MTRTVLGPIVSTVFLGLALALVLSVLSPSARAGQVQASTPPERPRIQVKGAARIEAHTARASGKIVLSGTVTDDAGRPASAERVRLSLARVGDTGPGGSVVVVAAASPEACADPSNGSSAAPALDAQDRLVLTTDAAGRFCVRLLLSTNRYVAHLEVRSSGFVDGSLLDWPLDLALKPVALRFDPVRSTLSLDNGPTDFDVVASTEEEGVTRAATGLRLAISNETGEVLGEATTTASGQAHFTVPGARLGPAGKGELRASFPGSAEAGASSFSMPVERQSRVDLSAPTAGAGQTSAASPEDGVPVRVVATCRCALDGCVNVPTGMVEALVGETVVGAATLDHGQARLLATFVAPVTPEVSLRLRYAADSPWFVPGREAVVTVPIKGPSPWGRVPWALASAAVVTWLVLARLPRRGGLLRSERGSSPPPRRVVAHVEVVSAAGGDGGWTGQVVDAHEDTIVGEALVSVERRGFERIEVVVETQADNAGRFALPAVELQPGDELVVEAPFHARLRGPVPERGDLRVALVLRKRALIERLVRWARKRGKPYDARPDPTPAHVRRAAGQEFAIARWADAIEQAAYGGSTLDARRQAEIDELGPAAPEAHEGGQGTERPEGGPEAGGGSPSRGPRAR